MTSIAPWMSVADTAAAIAFYEAAFGARVVERLGDDDVTFVALLTIGGAEVWLQLEPETAPDGRDGPVRMILTVDDPDATFARALAAGATEYAGIHEEHGWRIGHIVDPCGHHWEIGRRLAV